MRWLVLLLLAGCVSQAEVDQRNAYQAQQAEASRLIRMEYRCQQLGFTPHTAEFRQCMLQLDAQDAQERAQTRGVLLQHMLNNPSPGIAPLAPPPPIGRPQTTCYTDSLGITRCSR